MLAILTVLADMTRIRAGAGCSKETLGSQQQGQCKYHCYDCDRKFALHKGHSLFAADLETCANKAGLAKLLSHPNNAVH